MKKETLIKHYKSIKFVDCPEYDLKAIESFPASPGYMLIELIKRYKIPFKALGYYHDIVSIKTKNQSMLWRDSGTHATFLGIVNLSDLSVDLKSKDDTVNNKDVKPFNSFKDLSNEIKKRDYSGIVGLKANITQEDYFYFL
jgi:hypothetical protein